MIEPTLVVLAAGLGRRFGGTKQLVVVGPRGEAIVDYSASDARAAGFTTVVLVVRSEIEQAVARHVALWPADLRVRLVAEDREPLAVKAIAAGRSIPLGTAHAVAVAAAHIDGPFAVINADDLYGASAFRAVADQLTDGDQGADGALVTYTVANTVLGTAPVKRALCRVDELHCLSAIDEGTVSRDESGQLVWQGSAGRRRLSGDESVSMNFWGFPSSAAAALTAACEVFVASDRVAGNDEVLLPDVVGALMDAGTRFVALPSVDRCLGITHPDDLATLRAILTEPAW